MTVPRTAIPPLIDGFLGADEWAGAAEVTLAPGWEPEQPPADVAADVAAARLLWDDTHLYVLLGSLFPPSREQVELLESLRGGAPEALQSEPVETWRLGWDTRPPDHLRPGFPPKIAGGFELRLFVGVTSPATGETPILVETRAGCLGVSLRASRAAESWLPGKLRVAASASPGMVVELAIPFAELNGAHGMIAGRGMVAQLDLERFGPPEVGDLWEISVERRYDLHRHAAWGAALPQFPVRGGPPGTGPIRFAPPEETDRPRANAAVGASPADGSPIAVDPRIPPPFFHRNYRQAAELAQREGVLLLLIYAAEPLTASDHSPWAWHDPLWVELNRDVVLAVVDPRRLPPGVPPPIRGPSTQLVAWTPSGRVARRWTRLPPLREFVREVAALAREKLP